MSCIGLRYFNPFPNKPWFLHVCSTSLLKTQWEKEKLLETSNFSFSHSVFYLFGELSGIFYQTQNCHLPTLSIWKIVKFVVWERVKSISCHSDMTEMISTAVKQICPSDKLLFLLFQQISTSCKISLLV